MAHPQALPQQPEPVLVDTPQLGRTAASTMPVQVWHDEWRRADRVLRYTGKCLACSKPTWAFDDGENDPRGILGDAAQWTSYLELDGVEYELVTCALCANDEPSYRAAQRLATASIRGGRVRAGIVAVQP